MKTKKILTLILAMMMLFAQIVPVCAEETNPDEWYELVEEDFEVFGENELEQSITPYSLYLMNVYASIVKLNSSKVGMRADVPCSAVMKQITVTFYLQKLKGTSWSTVGSTTVYAYNTSSTTKSITASNLSSGTYRNKVSVKVTASNGYSETLTSYSGSINLP
ncbi:hypothetical protein ACTM97_06305 [Oliverpabstia intestinalis]|uniref:hypothetical protein n=1 Tax=Oliverpabstia intestinalis TaxID=2606633 RepID=UPI003F89F086